MKKIHEDNGPAECLRRNKTAGQWVSSSKYYFKSEKSKSEREMKMFQLSQTKPANLITIK